MGLIRALSVFLLVYVMLLTSVLSVLIASQLIVVANI